MSKYWVAKSGYKFLVTPQMREEYEYFTLKFADRQKESDDFDEEFGLPKVDYAMTKVLERERARLTPEF